MENKLKQIGDLEKIVDTLRQDKKLIVTTNGTFDILHYAHVILLQKAKNQGDVLIVLLNSDASVKKNKGEKRPIINQYERAMMLSSLQCIDYVTIFNEDTPLKYLEIIKPEFHVKGGSFIKERINQEKNLVERNKGVYIVFELEEGFSTTGIIDKIMASYNS